MIEQGGTVHNFGDLWSVILEGIAEANMPLGLGCVELQFFGETQTPPSPWETHSLFGKEKEPLFASFPR